MTPFNTVYDAFFNIITDDMYLEISPEQTARDCKGLLLASLPLFQLPKNPMDFSGDAFLRDLDLEEINILAAGMKIIWLERQLFSIELTRQKSTGPDFRMSSQAAHLDRLSRLKDSAEINYRSLQMLQSKRTVVNGNYKSTLDQLVKR